jgi:toxin ParE1/3/4
VAVEVVFAPGARDDLVSIYIWVERAAGGAVAERYQARIRKACLSLADFPNRGTLRGDLGQGVRSIPFERQATIAYRVLRGRVEILAIAHRGRDLDEPLA